LIKFIGALIVLAAVSIGSWLLETMWLMLAIGCIHANWLTSVPTVGFQAALPISFCLSAFFGSVVAVTVGMASRTK
jgi:hypothetical protein